MLRGMRDSEKTRGYLQVDSMEKNQGYLQVETPEKNLRLLIGRDSREKLEAINRQTLEKNRDYLKDGYGV